MSEWKKVKLKDCVKEVNERTTENNQYGVLTSSKSGIYSQEDYFDKQVASKDNTGYKIIKKGQFTYRSMSDNATFTINRLENKYIGIVSPAYPVFEATDINAEYLKYFFQSEEFRKEIYNLSQGSTRTALKYKDLSNIEIFIPPIEEQEAIVKILKSIDSIIEKYRNILEEKDNLIKSQFVEMFGNNIINDKKWKQINLEDISEIKSGGTPTRENPEFFKGTIPWITTVSLGKNVINENDAVEFITEEAINKSATKLIEKNSLLFGIRVGVGKISMNEVPMCTNQDIVAITKIDSRFRKLFLKKVIEEYSDYFNSQKRGTTIQGITTKILKKIKIPVVELELQDLFINFLKQIDKQKSLLEQQKKNYENLKKGLMQKLLTGKFRVKI